MKDFKDSQEEPLQKERLENEKNKNIIRANKARIKRYQFWLEFAKWAFIIVITYPIWSRLFMWTLKIPYPH